jgi:hypothetical protein
LAFTAQSEPMVLMEQGIALGASNSEQATEKGSIASQRNPDVLSRNVCVAIPFVLKSLSFV